MGKQHIFGVGKNPHFMSEKNAYRNAIHKEMPPTGLRETHYKAAHALDSWRWCWRWQSPFGFKAKPMRNSPHAKKGLPRKTQILFISLAGEEARYTSSPSPVLSVPHGAGVAGLQGLRGLGSHGRQVPLERHRKKQQDPGFQAGSPTNALRAFGQVAPTSASVFFPEMRGAGLDG